MTHSKISLILVFMIGIVFYTCGMELPEWVEDNKLVYRSGDGEVMYFKGIGTSLFSMEEARICAKGEAFESMVEYNNTVVEKVFEQTTSANDITIDTHTRDQVKTSASNNFQGVYIADEICYQEGDQWFCVILIGRSRCSIVDALITSTKQITRNITEQDFLEIVYQDESVSTVQDLPDIVLITPSDEDENNIKELDCDNCITNAWMFVPGGTFEMGDTWGDGDDDETPVHNVTLSDFYLHKYEVTFAEYDKCVQAGVCEESRYDGDDEYDQPDKPVNGVDWQDAMDYCTWIGGDLPTEAQWEYAASWGTENTHQKFKWALDKNNYDGSKYCDSIDPGDADTTCEIGSFAANGLGIYDLSGNVWEWCKDWYKDDWYEESASRNIDPLCNNDTSGGRVGRGGSWDSNDSGFLRSADRLRLNPAFRGFSMGFRCASLLQD